MIGRLFQCDPDIRVSGTEIYLDPKEPRKIGVISHAHADHIGRHEHFIATPATATFLRHRVGSDLRGTELAYGSPHASGDVLIELFPAGHVLGSAMIRVTRGGERLLYSGDFKLRPSLTCEAAIVPEADAVIIESTYGSARWKFGTCEEIESQLVSTVNEILDARKTPVLLAYSLGKAQEALAMLRGKDCRVIVHPTIAAICSIYEKHGIDLGEYEVWGRQATLFGARASSETKRKVVIVPPHLDGEIRKVRNRVAVALTGWALRGPIRGADRGIAMSDHGGFDELLELVQRSGARSVYITHGSSRELLGALRNRGYRAEILAHRPQMRLL